MGNKVHARLCACVRLCVSGSGWRISECGRGEWVQWGVITMKMALIKIHKKLCIAILMYFFMFATVSYHFGCHGIMFSSYTAKV